MSPVKTTPPAVGVTPATTGEPASYFHLTLPVSASIAVIHPFALPTCFFEPPENASPGTYFTSPDLNSAHQSTAPTYSARRSGSKAGPFHSTPPSVPGHATTPSGVGAPELLIVVTGVLNRSLCVLRSTT